MANYWVNFLGNCCELFTILFFLKGRYKPRVSRKLFIPVCFLLVGFQFLNTSLFLSKSYLIVLGSCLFIFCTFLLYNINWIYQIIFTIFIYLIYAFSELIVGMLLSIIFNIDISYAQNNAIIFAICTITSKFLAYFFVLITRQKRIKDETSFTKQNFLVFSLPIASFLVMVLFLRFCYLINDNGFLLTTLVITIILAFSNIAVFYITDKQNELLETKEKLLFVEKHINSQIIHYEELYKYQNELRAFRHDIQNESISLIGLLKDGKIEKALHSLEKSINWLEENNNIIVNSGNPVIDAILQSKIYYAKEKNISIRVSTKLTTQIKIDEVELGIILGNSLDNAIEASEKVSYLQDKEITFSLISTEDRISVSIENPVEKNVDVNNLSTTKINKNKHGFGIQSIRTIAQKYDGIILFSCENNNFVININLSNH